MLQTIDQDLFQTGPSYAVRIFIQILLKVLDRILGFLSEDPICRPAVIAGLIQSILQIPDTLTPVTKAQNAGRRCLLMLQLATDLTGTLPDTDGKIRQRGNDLPLAEVVRDHRHFFCFFQPAYLAGMSMFSLGRTGRLQRYRPFPERMGKFCNTLCVHIAAYLTNSGLFSFFAAGRFFFNRPFPVGVGYLLNFTSLGRTADRTAVFLHARSVAGCLPRSSP